MQCGDAIDLAATDGDPSGVVSADDQLLIELAHATAGEYQIERELGRGGMAAVYLALDLALGRRVAIKVMIPGLAATDGMADRFLLEARTAAQLSHPNIIPIYAVRNVGRLRYFAMKHVSGRSLDRILAHHGPLPAAIVQSVLTQVGQALEHAHRRGVVHRDIKPANIMIDEDGTPIVADFGIAKVGQGVSLTQTGSTIGTPTYMSPEQCSGRPVTGASDQYSLGCVAFELLAGRPPFTHQDVLPVLLAHVSEVPPPLLALRADCPLELAAAIDKMLAKDPAERWANIAEAIAAAEASPHASNPGVRDELRLLSGAETSPPLAPLPSVPVSPIPVSRTVVSAPTTAQGSGPVPEVFALAIQPNGATLQAGAGLQFRATARDRSGLPVSAASVSWRSSAPAVATVSEEGVVTARQMGEVEITAQADSVRAAVQLRVTPVPVSRVRIVSPAPSCRVGEQWALSAVAVDQAGAVLPGRAITWTSTDPQVAVVDAQGTVHGRSVGRAQIRAECEGQSAEVAAEITGVTGNLIIRPGEGAMAVGQVVRLQPAFRDEQGVPRPVAEASWSSSDPTVLRVTAEGEVTAFRPGSARIRASFGGQVTEVEFQVTRVDVAQVRLTPPLATLGVGESVRLEAHATDRFGSALRGRVVTWTSSRADLATVDVDGTVRALSAGTVRISAAVGGGLAWVEIRVTPVSVSAIRLEPSALALRIGEPTRVHVGVQGPNGGGLAGVRIDWESSDPSVAVVSPDGMVTGIRFGTARIAATAGGRRATIPVEVRAPSAVSGPRPFP